MIADVWVTAQELAKIASAQRSQLAVIERGHIGRARQTAYQSHLTEEITSAKLDLPLPNTDLNFTLRDEINGIGLVPRSNDSFTRLHAACAEVQE